MRIRPALLLVLVVSIACASVSAQAGVNRFTSISPFTAASVRDVVIDPSQSSTLFAATEAGVVKSEDSGKNWSEPTLDYGNAQLAIDPRNSTTLFAFTRKASAQSVDGGESWAAINPGNQVTGIAVDPSNSAVVYAVLADGLAKSTDGGAKWTPIGVGQVPLAYYGFDGGAISVDPVVPTTVYAAGTGGIIKSADAGTTWKEMLVFGWTFNYGPFFRTVVIDPRTPSTIYALSETTFYRSDNAGKDWQVVSSTDRGGGNYFTDLAIDPIEPSRLYLATTFGLFQSLYRGEQLTELNEGLPTRWVNAVSVDSLGNVYAATSRGLFVNSPERKELLPGASTLSVSLRTQAGNFVSAENCGGSFLNANASSAGRCQTFTMFDLNAGPLNDGDIIHLRSANGGFVVAEGGGSADGSAAAVNANRDFPREWETFVIHGVSGNGPIRSGDAIRLRSWSGSFVSAEYGGSNGCQCDSRLNANRSPAGIWETFVIGVQSAVQEPPPSMLAFVSERDGNSEIYVMNVDGTGLLRLTDDAGLDGDPAWSPDGKRIAFASDRAGSSDIYVMDADGSNLVRRTQSGSNNGAPAWSADGEKIAFSSLRGGQFGIYVMSVDGDWANPTRVGYDRGWNTHPAWSPDGKRIAFVSDWRAFDFVYDVYAMNADGSQITTLFAGPFFGPPWTYYFQPSWSPDGAKIAVVVCAYAWDNCYPSSSIAIANADGSGLKTLVQTGGYARPTWSPDGSTIAFSSQACRACGGELRYVSADGSKSGVIFSNGHDPAWRP